MNDDTCLDVHITKVKSAEHVELLRILRNECRHFMTRNNNMITQDEQKTWYDNLDHSKYKLFLVDCIYHGTIVITVGFGILRIEDDKVLLTGGIAENYRGRGLGKKLFSFLLDNAKYFDKKIALEVLITNEVAFKLYKKLGFVEYDRNDKVIKMEYKQ